MLTIASHRHPLRRLPVLVRRTAKSATGGPHDDERDAIAQKDERMSYVERELRSIRAKLDAVIDKVSADDAMPFDWPDRDNGNGAQA